MIESGIHIKINDGGYYQSTSFHDALYLRGALGLKPAPEFEAWLRAMGVTRTLATERIPPGLAPALIGLE